MQSKAVSVEQYLRELPEDRRHAIGVVRTVILASIDKNVTEGMQYGHIGYFIPHRVYPAGYHCDPKQPLPYLSLASQKNHMAIYFCALYVGDGTGENQLLEWFQAEWKKSGKKLDMGKSCIRFKKLDDLNMDIIRQMIAKFPSKEYIASYERGLQMISERKFVRSPKRPTTRKTTTKAKKKITKQGK